MTTESKLQPDTAGPFDVNRKAFEDRKVAEIKANHEAIKLRCGKMADNLRKLLQHINEAIKMADLNAEGLAKYDITTGQVYWDAALKSALEVLP